MGNETVYGWCFCGESLPCDCDCENCAPIEGQYVNNAPCCWKVVIAGIAVTDPEQCADCDDLNRTYYLSQDQETPCLWKSTACECGETAITLEISESNGQYAITVTLGGHVWLKTYDAPPDCCAIAEELLTHQSSSGECDSTSATCEISAAYDGDCRGYYCMDVEVSGIDRNNGDCGCPSCGTLNKAWKLPLVKSTSHGSLVGETWYSRTLCSSDDPYYRCHYSHIKSEINIASEEATTGTVQLWIFQYTGHINKDPHEDSGSFMYWSATVTREEGQTWAEALGEYITLTYQSQSGADEFDCDGSSATVKIKVVAYTPSCLGVCEPGTWCVSRSATCKTRLKCYGDEWPGRIDVTLDEGLFYEYYGVMPNIVGWDYTPIAGATLTYHDAQTDHPQILPFTDPHGQEASEWNIGYRYLSIDKFHSGFPCSWSYLSEPFEFHRESSRCRRSDGSLYVSGDIEEYTRWRYSITAWNKWILPPTPSYQPGNGQEWRVRVAIMSYKWWYSTAIGYWASYWRYVHAFFTASQSSPCNGTLLDCFLGDAPMALSYWGISEGSGGAWGGSCAAPYPWQLDNTLGLTIEPG